MHSSIVVRLYKGTFAFGFQICSKNSTFHKEKLVTPSNIFSLLINVTLCPRIFFLWKRIIRARKRRTTNFKCLTVKLCWTMLSFHCLKLWLILFLEKLDIGHRKVSNFKSLFLCKDVWFILHRFGLYNTGNTGIWCMCAFWKEIWSNVIFSLRRSPCSHDVPITKNYSVPLNLVVKIDKL